MFNNLWLPAGYFLLLGIVIVLFIRFAVKKKRGGMMVTIAVALSMIAGNVVYSMPHGIVAVEADNVYRID